MANSRRTKKKSSKANVKANKKNTDIRGIAWICVSLILAFGIYTNSAGYLSYLSKFIFRSLFGMTTFLIPIFMLYISIIYIIKKGIISLSKEFWGICLTVLNTSLLVQTLTFTRYYDETSITKSLKLIINSSDFWHGGIIGFLITLPIYKFLGSIGTYILLLSLYIICFIIVFGVTLEDIGLSIKANKKKVKTAISKPKNEEEYINLNDGEDKKEEFITGLNNKIKILDFMKNASIHEESQETEIAVENSFPKEKLEKEQQPKGKSSEVTKVDQAVTEDVNKELNEKLMKHNENLEYKFPSTDLLNINSNLKANKEEKREILANASKLVETLNSFGVEANVVQVSKGPSVTRFELQPSAGVKVSKIVNLADDIALSLAASGVRIEAPIPGKAAVGIEVPNKEQTAVFLREVLDSEEFINTNSKLAFALGKDIGGKCIVGDLSRMPHLLIAGATGSGKSVCINTLIISIIYKYSPQDVKLLMIDPKVVELNVYNGIPHLLIPVVTDPKKAAAALNWAVNEMTRRYKLFADSGVRNIESYNSLLDKGIIEEKLPWIVMIVDELADLMMVCPHDVEDYIARLAQMARAAGMHLVIATQRPSVDVITGVIKANIPSRISFAVSSQIDSRTILDSSGAEKLLGKGDMLYYPVGESKPIRIQGAFISEGEVENVVNSIKQSEEEVVYQSEIIEHINNESSDSSTGSDDVDELLDEAIKIVIDTGQASTSFLQRKLKIGFNRASRIMDQLEENGIISPRDGSKPRQVLVSRDEDRY